LSGLRGGGREKCARVVSEFGFDACVDYRAEDFASTLTEACPGGIDAYFENVGGPVQQAVFPLLNDFARVAMCGQVAQYSGAGVMPGPNLMAVVLRRLELKGFLASDHYPRLSDFTRQVEEWVRAGGVRQAVTVSAGDIALHEAINMMANGRNFGQQLHQLCSDEALAQALGGALPS
jgi:NADPH-dependent curcumin reductase CurA